VTTLVTAEATMIGEDVEVTEGLAHFFILEEPNGPTTFNLITRRLSRGLASCHLLWPSVGDQESNQ
jgi:hypothetical protein